MWPYLIFLIALGVTLLFGVWAKHRARGVFQEFVSWGLKEPMTGALAAGAICREGRAWVVVQSGGRYLSRHYDLSLKTLSLDPHTYEGRSITAIGKGIFEAGHVLQERQCYRWFRWRPGTLPISNFGTRNFGPFCLYGMLLEAISWRSAHERSGRPGRAHDELSDGMASVAGFLADSAFIVAALLFLAVVVSQLVALWVGLDASKRATAALAKAEFATTRAERESLQRVIQSAPWAYVGAALTALVSIPSRNAMEAPIHLDARDGLATFDYY